MKKKNMDITVTNTWKDRVCPSMIEFNKTDFQLENAVCTVYSIFSYPSSGDLKWLKRAVSSIENTMVVIYNETGDKKELLDSVDYSVREKRVHISETIDTKEREALGAQAEIDRMMEFSQRIMSKSQGKDPGHRRYPKGRRRCLSPVSATNKKRQLRHRRRFQ